MRDTIKANKTALALVIDTEGSTSFDREILDQANYELFLALQRIEKAQAGLAEGTSQWTLATRRQKALRLAMALIAKKLAGTLDPGPFYHGTKADLNTGDILEIGYSSNYGLREIAAHIYFSATMDAAIWGAELAKGTGKERIYIVKPTGSFEDDPDLTDARYPGNPTRSYRSKMPLKVAGNVTDWKGHDTDELKAMLDHLEKIESTRSECHLPKR